MKNSDSPSPAQYPPSSLMHCHSQSADNSFSPSLSYTSGPHGTGLSSPPAQYPPSGHASHTCPTRFSRWKYPGLHTQSLMYMPARLLVRFSSTVNDSYTWHSPAALARRHSRGHGVHAVAPMYDE